MNTQPTRQLLRPRRAPITDPIAEARPYDYADAFEVQVPTAAQCTPEEWIRAGFANTGPVVNWVVRQLGAVDDPNDVLRGWRVVESTPQVLHLEQSDALMDTVVICRNPAPGYRTFTTLLRYHRPVLARLIWSVVGILHRSTAKKVITSVPAEPTDNGER